MALNTSMKEEMRQRLVRRTPKHSPALTPFLIGASVGALPNRRDTRRLAEHVRRDLCAARRPWDELPGLPGAPAGHGPVDGAPPLD